MSAGMAIHKHTLTVTFLPGTMEVEALTLSDLDLDLEAVQKAAGMSNSGSLACVVSPPHDCPLSHQSILLPAPGLYYGMYYMSLPLINECINLWTTARTSLLAAQKLDCDAAASTAICWYHMYENTCVWTVQLPYIEFFNGGTGALTCIWTCSYRLQRSGKRCFVTTAAQQMMRSYALDDSRHQNLLSLT